jgi:hypothetical protein
LYNECAISIPKNIQITVVNIDNLTEFHNATIVDFSVKTDKLSTVHWNSIDTPSESTNIKKIIISIGNSAKTYNQIKYGFANLSK